MDLSHGFEHIRTNVVVHCVTTTRAQDSAQICEKDPSNTGQTTLILGDYRLPQRALLLRARFACILQ